MSDRAQGSVRTATNEVDGAPGEQLPPSATQAIPTTGSQRAAGGAPAAPSVLAGSPGSPATAGAPVDGAAEARPAAATKAPGRTASKSGGRGPRRARLQLRHIDTWSALKISLVLSIALFFIWMVAVGLLYGVLSALGVFNTLNDLFGQLGSASGSAGGGDVITPGVVFGSAAIIGAINVVLLTALCTVGTFIYNLCADLVGGLEVTLSERD
jgi:Transmembrane domain of unknown function (DUF3566)